MLINHHVPLIHTASTYILYSFQNQYIYTHIRVDWQISKIKVKHVRIRINFP
jgi:hypothetical protein